MQVILNERVKSLGNVGEVVNVSAGYARNYLIPKKFAIFADMQNKKFVANQQKILSKKINAEKAAAVELKKKIETVSTQIYKRVGGNGKLFGTVTAAELSALLLEKGIDVEKRLIKVNPPIKQTGDFEVQVALLNDCIATFKVKVSIDLAQVEEMKKKQLAAKDRKANEAKKQEAELAAAENGEQTDDAANAE